jgi:formylglycine-generating enzyme required for sulfatase activity
MVMAYVPAGEFLMGSPDSDSCAQDDEKPQHSVFLDAFWVDQTEVTNSQYRQCVQAGSCPTPTCDYGESTYPDPAMTNHPVVCMSWENARTYCLWAGARLLTEAEWEKAARGGNGRRYPWGSTDPNCQRANYSHCVDGTDQVGVRTAGASPYGALDMAGNVWEWVADWYDENYYAYAPDWNPQGPDSGTRRVARGGAYWHDSCGVTSANRINNPPHLRDSKWGFRCGVSATPAP